MAEAAQIVLEHCQPEMLDLNFGCPTPKIVKNGDGAALMREPKLLEEIVAAVVRVSTVPVTAKIRLGWDKHSINCVEVAQRAADAGAHWITIHARTRDQFYAGKADWTWIRRVVQACSVPVVATAMFSVRQTLCGCWRRRDAPCCNWPQCPRQSMDLSRCAGGSAGRGDTAAPTIAERIGVAWRHLELKASYDGVQRAIKEMRPHLAWYLKGIPHSAEIRRQLNTAASMEEVRGLLVKLLPKNSPFVDKMAIVPFLHQFATIDVNKVCT